MTAADIGTLSPRERDVIALMAQGRTNHGIARRLSMSERTVESHVTSMFTKLGFAPGRDDHRRVLAVLAFLGQLTP